MAEGAALGDLRLFDLAIDLAILVISSKGFWRCDKCTFISKRRFLCYLGPLRYRSLDELCTE